MTHARKSLRDAVVAAVTGLTTTGARVFATHSERLVASEADLPCLLVYYAADTEQSEHDSDENLSRQVRIVVRALVKEATGAEDVLDAIAEDVESSVPRTVGGALDCIPVSTKVTFPTDAGDAEIASIAIEFLVWYRTQIGNPGTLV